MARTLSATVTAALVVLGMARTAAAQPASHAFAYGGPTALFESGAPPLANFGGGVDFLAPSGAGGSIEIGRLGLNGMWVNQLSINALYEVPQVRGRRVTPFVSGGYSALFNGDGGAHGLNVGGGANLWVNPRLAVRVEARDHILPGEGAVQALSFRFGVTFR